MPRSLALVLALYGVAVLAAQGGGPTRREIDALGPQAGQRALDFPLTGQNGQSHTQAATAHLTLAASASDAVVAPGTHVSLMIDVMPKLKMHVYAPGAKDYQPIALTIAPQPGVTVRDTVYPKSEILFFEPLKERVPVYAKPFRLVRDIALDASPQAQARFKQMQTLTVSGKVAYQACDDKICYVPTSVPVSWTFTLRTLDRERTKK